MAHTLDISFGPESEFLSTGPVSFIAANPLDDTRFFVAYSDTNALAIGKVSVGSVSGSTVTFGSGNAFNNTGSQQIAADKLENNKIFVAYSDWSSGQNRHGKVKIGTASASGTDVVFGTDYKFWASEVTEVAAISLSATKFVVAFRDETTLNHGVAKIGTVSGTTVTFGSAFEFLSEDGASDMAMTRLDNDRFVVAYQNQLINKGEALIGSVSGDSITFGTATVFDDPGTNDIAIESFDPNKFVLVHNGLVSPAVIGTISGTNITFGIDAEMSLPNGWNTPAIAILDQDHFVTAFRDRSGNIGSTQIGNVTGTTITVGAKGLFNAIPNGTAATQIFVVDNSKFVVLYQDDGDSGHGTAKVGTIPISFKSMDFYIRVPDGFSSSLGTPESPNLDIVMSGGISGVPQPKPLIRIINHLTKTHDHDPQLITNFIGIPNSVNIQLWDIVDGKNTLATITSSGCYSIGKTNRWAWSTEHLQFLNNNDKYHYYFRMASDLGEENFGEFFITVPERGRWSYPD